MPVEGFILHIARGDSPWTERSLPPGEYIIGRSPDCAISFQVNEISRQHARLELGADGLFLTDLGSSNGTQLEGRPLPPRERVPLKPGHVFTILDFRFMVEPAVETASPAAAPAPQPVSTQTGAVTSEVSPAPPPPPPPPQPSSSLIPVLRCMLPGGQWVEYTLQQGEQYIGRENCQILLPYPTISRRHARLMVSGSEVMIADCGSRNGIYLQGQKLVPNQLTLLATNAPFEIEEFTFELVLRPTAASAGLDCMTVTDPAALAAAPVAVATAGLNLLGLEKVTIGRAPDNRIVLDHPLVSRYHAVIERMGTRSRLLDLHSANGVYVNQQRVSESAWLNPGDTIRIGPYQLQFTGNELRQSAAEGYAVTVVGLNKWVSKDLNLLKDISLAIGKNEFVALVGMSGAGKSTLQDAINGFRPATHGQVLVNGVDLYRHYEMFRDDIGNVPQRDIVHMELTPAQELEYAARLRMPPDTTPEERQKAIRETLEDLDLTARRDVPIHKLSGGQLKRVSIGVELLTKPHLFFLDEPTSGLDPGTEYEMMRLLRRLADQGRTVMLITHATKNVMFCDKVIILARGGNLAFFGPPENALEYFDSFRTSRERLEKKMEFDDIYRILQDEKRGTPDEWRQRYLNSPYARFIYPGQQPYAVPEAAAAAAMTTRRKRISPLRQFFVLSARNLRCMFQDKITLMLTIALAPILGLMNFIWGFDMFDPVTGDAAKIMALWFMVAVVAILAGAMGSVREIVKELEIYKRERAVGLQIFPYVLSKVWIGVILAVYQGVVLTGFTLVLTRPVITGQGGLPAIFFTTILAIICGYLLGLVISSIAPNQSSAQIILIAALVPQFVLTGVLQPLHRIPLGNYLSLPISTRWAYEAYVNASGMGDNMVADPCWQLPKAQRVLLTTTQKESCFCMGPNIFINCAAFPGVQSPDFYDEAARLALSQQEPTKPVQPTRLPSPSPMPSPTMLPTPRLGATPSPYPTPAPLPLVLWFDPSTKATQMAGLPADEVIERLSNEIITYYRDYKYNTEQMINNYRLKREGQFASYAADMMVVVDQYKEKVKGQISEYIEHEAEVMNEYSKQVEKQFTDYFDQVERYGEELTDWQKNRQEAIGAAETILGMVWDNYGVAFKGNPYTRWLYMGLIGLGEFILILLFMKRKDVV